jgi:hypothetical protein
MMTYYTDSDESILIGVFSAEREPEDIIKIVGKLLSNDFFEASSDDYDDLGEFEYDTVVISSVDFSEDLLDIIKKDIKIYVV